MLKRNTFIGCFAGAPSHSPSLPLISLLFLSLLTLFGFVGTSHAQAIPTADKTGALDAFGALNITGTDYTQGITGYAHDSASIDAGVTAGASFALRKFFWGQPVIAGRYSFVHGATANETFMGGGGELRYHYQRFRPYITVLGGIGSLSVPTTGYKDTGNALLVGGGTNYPLAPRFSARAEFNYSFVDITGFDNTQAGAKSLTPWSFNLGIVYHIK